MLKLMSSDQVTFEVDPQIAFQSQTIKNLVEDAGADDVIPLPNVSGKILSRVIEYIKYHVDAKQKGPDDKPVKSDDDIKHWNEEFVKVDKPTLFELILASNYLDVQGLLDLTCQTAANMIKGKTPEEMREIFNIKNDFTPEEEEQVRRENQWAF